MILLDTSGLLAAIHSNQTHHSGAAKSLSCARPPLPLSPFVLAELNYFIASRVGYAARASLLEEVERGAYALEPMTARDITSVHTRSLTVTPTSGSASPTHRSSCSRSATASGMS